MATPHAAEETVAVASGIGKALPVGELSGPWDTARRPLNTKLLELTGKYKDIFDALGGGEALLKELRRDPEEKRP